MTADIDLKGSETNPWSSIGTGTNPFQGTFDGNGHTITGLYIDGYNYEGLFGYVKYGTVKNLTVSGTVSGRTCVGIIVGFLDWRGLISNCHSSGTVSGSMEVGGLVGEVASYSNMVNCSSSCTVTGKNDSGLYIGGLVGYLYEATVNNCYFTGSVSGGSGVGGLVGSVNYSTLKNSHSVGTSSEDALVSFAHGTVNNCYCLHWSDYGTIKTDAQFASGEVTWLLQNGQESQVWGQLLRTDRYPVFSSATDKKIVKVSFVNGSEEHSALYLNNGGIVRSVPTPPSETDSTFVMWAENKNDLPFRPGTTVHGNLTLHAIFQEKTPSGIGIDFVNETLTGVDTSASYAINNAAVSFTDGKLRISDYIGTTISICRTGRDSYHLDSSAATLAIPARPNAPSAGTFPINYSAETVTVPSGYYYNTTGTGAYTDSGWKAGDGTAVSAAPGSSIYLYKAATASAFKSAVLPLTVPSRGTFTAPAINFANETIATTTAMEYKVGDGSWTSCTKDMAATTFGWNGSAAVTVQFRAKATADKYASAPVSVVIPARPDAPSLRIDNGTERVTIPSGYCYNTTSANDSGTWTAGSGSAVTVAPGSSIYIRKAATASAFKSNVQTLSAPSRSATPAVTIDYTAETLSTTTAMEYSTDSGTSWTACTANMAATTFGWDGSAAVTVQFRAKATADNYASQAQTVTIPARPDAPSLRIDNSTERVTVPSGYLYNFSSANDSGAWTAGSGSAVTVAPDSSIYICKAATASAFKSHVQTLSAPSRGATPTVTIDYTAETLSTTTAMEYSKDSGASWTDCTANMAATAFGWDGSAAVTVQFRTKATADNYASAATEFTIPARPAAPDSSAYAIDYAGETISFDSDVYEMNTDSGFGSGTAAASGSAVTPDSTLYIRQKAVAGSAFKSDALTVAVPARPDAPTPTVKSKTYHSVTLEEIPGAQYSKDGGATWQDSPTFTALTSNTSYSFVAQYKATDTSFASPVSEPVAVTTDKVPPNTYPPIIEDTEHGTVTVSPGYPTAGDKVTITPTPDKGYAVDTVLVTDHSGNPVAVTDNGDGTYTFTQPKGKVTISVTFKEIQQAGTPFADVFPSDYYYDAVLWAAENGITGGVDDTHFAPNSPCTRAQAVTFLWRAAGCPAPQSSEMPFTDVAAGSYYYDAVLWAVENGITKGTSDSSFSPDAICSRGQIVTFLWRSQGSPAAAGENTFTDVAAGSYYYDAVLWAVENGITKGTSDTTFSPDAICSRGQIVTFLWRSQGSPAAAGENTFTDVAADSYCADAVLWAVENGITKGTSDSAFSPANNCTRGQIVTFLYRCLGGE